MRLFYAVRFSKDEEKYLIEIQEGLKKTIKSGRWVDIKNCHLTLHFLGDIERRELPFFKEALDSSIRGIKPFNVRFSSLGSFRQKDNYLIYVKTKNTSRSLEEIAKGLKKTGRGDLKTFVPHITMVRRAVINFSTLKLLKKKRFKFDPIYIDCIHLVESKKIDGKIVYTSVYSSKLENIENENANF